MKDEIRNRRIQNDLKYASVKRRHHNNSISSNIEINKINIKELSKFCDRPIQYKNFLNNSTFSYDKANKNSENNSNINKIRKENNIINLNNFSKYNNKTNCKKSIVIFMDRPKKLSDYILKEKSNSQKKIYKMIFIEEDDLKGINGTRSNNYNSTKNFLKAPKEDVKFPNYNVHSRYNDIFVNNNIYRKKLHVNLNKSKKMKDYLPHIIKIQSFWKGFHTRKIYFRNIKIISASKIYKIIYKKVIGIKKNFIKILFDKLQNIYNNSSQKKSFFDQKKLKKNNRIHVNKYQNKTNIENSHNNYIYKRKNKSPGNHLSSNKNPSNNIQVHNLKAIPKKEIINNNYDIWDNNYYIKAIEDEIHNLIKYINRRVALLFFPTFLYRLKILQRIDLVEHRYNCLYNIIKIREKTKLYQYLQKYKNIIFSESIKNETKNNNDKNNTNLINNDDNINNNNIKPIKINKRKKYLVKKNSLNSGNKRISHLKKIIQMIEFKNNNKLLKKYFYKWKNLISKEIILSNLKNKLSRSDIMAKHNSMGSPRKKQIKIKKIKSNNNPSNSKILNKSTKQNPLNSFFSESLNIKKMKVHKMKVFVEPKNLYNDGFKDLNIISKKSSSDNSYFITKVASISNKISNKMNMYNCFKFWKKKSKQIKEQ